MSKEAKIEIGGRLTFVSTKYGDAPSRDMVSIDYIEHSPVVDGSDTETSVRLEEGDARQIVSFLCNAFPAIPDPAGAITDEMVERACARHHYIVTRGDWQEWARVHPSLAKRDRAAMRAALISAGKE